MSALGMIDWEAAYASRGERMRASEIRELLKILDQPGVVSFAGGIPDPALFPTEAVQRACADILTDPALGPQSLQYSVSEGHAPLRRWIVSYMAKLGIPCDIENIVITGGSQQGLDLLGKLFLSPGDTALVTAPTYLGALQAFNAYEPRYDRLDLNGGNMTPAAYADAAKQAGGRVGFAYVVSDFANPTGETVPESARLALLDLVQELDVPLFEDAAYHALRFEGEAVPSCLALDVKRTGDINASRVVFAGTFSKTICPGMRVGWLCASRDLIQKIVLAKQACDLHSSTLNQAIIQRVAEAEYDRLLPRIIDAYRSRRDAMLKALEKHMPAGVTWTRPQGGMFVWVTLPERLDGAKLLKLALEEEKIAFVPGGAFFADGTGKNTLRLSYSLASEELIADCMARLGQLLKRQLA